MVLLLLQSGCWHDPIALMGLPNGSSVLISVTPWHRIYTKPHEAVKGEHFVLSFDFKKCGVYVACAQSQSSSEWEVSLTLVSFILWQFQINYTRLLDDLDTELKEDLRSGRHLPRIVDKALRLFNLKQVVQEVETSVMSKVSCTACKAGNYTLVQNGRLYSYRAEENIF
jgi:hypothetical protein